MLRENNLFLIGHLAQNTNHIGGQTIKSRNVYEGLKNEGYSINVFDTYVLKQKKWKIFSLLFQIILHNKIILIPARNNLLFLVPYIYIWKKILQKCIILVAVGGWLGEFVKEHKSHHWLLRRIGPILVQNETLMDKLSTEFYFENVSTLHNFKIYDFEPTIEKHSERLKIVFLGRIMPEKGADIIFDICNKISTEENPTDVTIHFIGPVVKDYKSIFLSKVTEFDFVKYLGPIHPEELYSVLDKYDLMLFPTKYNGEGFPGVILDAFNVGMPVISTNWKDIPAVITDGENGYLIDVDDVDMIYSILNKLRSDYELLYKLKLNALQSSKMYSAESGIKILKNLIDQ